MTDVHTWLDSLGLSQYAEVFEENAIAMDQLASLSDAELKELGVHALGHRKRIRDNAASINASSPSPDRGVPKRLAEAILASRAAVEGERKQVTVLFADVVGSTALIRTLDAEDAVEKLRPAIFAMTTAVHRYEGLVNRVQGDGIMALFGAPIAHEDHAVRACLAALEMRDAVAALPNDSLEIRVGLNSGEVIVRAIRNDLTVEYEADGPTVHLGARMEQLAEPGTIRATEATARLATGHVEWRALDSVPVKGVTESIEQVEIQRTVESASRWEIRARGGLSRYVGREAELGTLDQALALAREGHGQVVSVAGEPGMGKSRLVHEFLFARVPAEWTVHVTAGSSYGAGTPYLPINQLLRSVLGAGAGVGVQAFGRRINESIDAFGPQLHGARAALLTLAGVPVEDDGWNSLEPAQRRRGVMDAFRSLVLRWAERSPLLLVFEDFHWLDTETQAALDELVQSVPGVGLMLLVSYRPEYQDHWVGKSWHRRIQLSSLGETATDVLLGALLGDDPSLIALRPLLAETTEGRPLFIEETVRSLAEEGRLAGQTGNYRLTGPVEKIRVPDSVQAVLASRIDRLEPEAKQVLQAAAVIGREVPQGLLSAVTELTEADLASYLRSLQAGEFLFLREVLPEPVYAFKHAMTELVAYEGLLRVSRVKLHGAALDAMQSADRRGIHDEATLARHACEGERWKEAVQYLRLAVDKSAAQSAHTQARGFLEQALSAVAKLQSSAESTEYAIDFRLDLRNTWLALGEFGETVSLLLEEAQSLAESFGDDRRHARVFSHLCHHLWLTGEHQRALDTGKRGRDIAVRSGDKQTEAELLHRMGQVYHSLGDYRLGAAAIQSSDVVIRVRSDTPGVPSVVARTFEAWCLLELGDIKEATRISEENLRTANESKLPWAVIVASMGAGAAYLAQGALDRAIPPLEEAIRLSAASDLPVLFPWAGPCLGTAYTRANRLAEGLELLEETVNRARAMGVWASQSLRLTRLSECYLRVDRLDDAADVACKALELARRYSERGHEAWALWAKAEVSAAVSTTDTKLAVDSYNEALSYAEELDMLPLVARCHSGLARLYEYSGSQHSAEHHRTVAKHLCEEMGITLHSTR